MTWSKEEDFVLSLYNRSLLARFEVDEILKILDEAHDTIRNSFPKLPEVLKKALSTRLEIRRTFLAAVDFGHSNHKETIRDWETCNALLPVLKTTHHLGKPVEGSFSVKLQRKLASTVPPRAVVVVNFDDAWDIFSRICHGGESAYRILDYHGGTWLQVCSCSTSARFQKINIGGTCRISYGPSNQERHSHRHTSDVCFNH